MQEGNALLEAGVTEDILRLRLTVSESPDIVNVYIGEIRNLDENEKLKISCDTFEEVLELIVFGIG